MVYGREGRNNSRQEKEREEKRLGERENEKVKNVDVVYLSVASKD